MSFTITNNVLVSLLIHLFSYILQNVSESIFLRNRTAGSKMCIFMSILILIEKLPDYFSPQKKKKRQIKNSASFLSNQQSIRGNLEIL